MKRGYASVNACHRMATNFTGGILLLHLFNIGQEHLAFDSESGALHQIDQLAAAVLKTYDEQGGKRPPAAVVEQLQAQLGQDVSGCCDDIDQLITAGQLFSSPVDAAVSQLYPDGPRIKSMCLHLCHDCNLRCRYCFAGTGDFGTGHRSMLSSETGRTAVDFLIKASGPRQHLDIDFFGGEPLMNWPVVMDLVSYCEQQAARSGKKIRLTLTTNAVLLDDEKTAYLNQHFDNVVLSIDGRPHVHDNMRPDAGQRGSYEKVASNIERFVKARGGKTYYLRGTFTRHNLDFDQDVTHMRKLASQLSLEPVVAPPNTDYAIKSEDLPLIEQAYERLAQDYAASALSGEPYNFFHFMLDLGRGPCAFKRLKGCGVGLEYIAVTPEGDIYPCHQFVGIPDFKMGHVSQSPDQLSQAVRQPFESLMLPDKPACRDCWARWFCSGGCAANAWHDSGTLDGLYEIGCAMQKKRLECALWIKAKLTEST